MSNQAEVLRNSISRVRQPEAAWLNAKWRERLHIIVVGAVLPIIVIVLWQLLGAFGVISANFLPTPFAIAASFKDLLVNGDLIRHLQISLGRAAVGLLIGGSIGLLFGLGVGFSDKMEKLLDPSMQMVRMIPHLALAPLIILWFGFGEVSKIFIIANGAFFPLYINTFMGIRNVDNKLFEVSRVLEFSRTKQIFKLILPASLPNIFLGLRLSLALSWLGLVVAELIGSQEGVGFLINFAKQNSNTEVIFVGIIIFAAVGLLVDVSVRFLERKYLQWREGFQG
ncbi:ABC transporter permease [Paenibacillus periandrae]|uniref:ABC transporter permease n=1 Tax=Paenibacillus periandrae TaxID=1761741 RepID=UPI001F091C83|nr:ABC transporter permease [Paenibacillus periandrae]